MTGQVAAKTAGGALEIRLATRADAPGISLLIAPLAQQFIAADLPGGQARKLIRGMTPEAIRRYLADGYRYHLALRDGELIGVVGTRDESHLFHLFVAEAAHGQGIARRLWEVARAACIAAGGSGAFTVNASQYAVGLYAHLGFVRSAASGDTSGAICVPMHLDAPGAGSS